MGEIHELFVLALSLVWFAGTTPEKPRFRNTRMLGRRPELIFSQPGMFATLASLIGLSWAALLSWWEELKFIEYCGAALGFLCGCWQLAAYNELTEVLNRLLRLLPPHPKNLLRLFLGSNLARQKITSKISTALLLNEVSEKSFEIWNEVSENFSEICSEICPEIRPEFFCAFLAGRKVLPQNFTRLFPSEISNFKSNSKSNFAKYF